MDANGKPILIYCTFPDAELARAVAGELVERRLAACVNILGAVTSIYNWAGERQEEAEVAALVKTVEARSSAVVDYVRSRHPYENPALVTLPVTGGSAAFLAWIVSETASSETAERNA